MVQGFHHMKTFTAAARKLMEAGHVDAERGLFSQTLFMSASSRDAFPTIAAAEAASAQGWSMVCLEFGPGSKARGPSSYSVYLRDPADAPGVFHDCMLALGEDGTFALVPIGDLAATYHFGVGPHGLTRRHGRPPNLAAAMIRARRALIEANRTTEAGPSVEVHMSKDRAA